MKTIQILTEEEVKEMIRIKEQIDISDWLEKIIKESLKKK